MVEMAPQRWWVPQYDLDLPNFTGVGAHEWTRFVHYPACTASSILCFWILRSILFATEFIWSMIHGCAAPLFFCMGKGTLVWQHRSHPQVIKLANSLFAHLEEASGVDAKTKKTGILPFGYIIIIAKAGSSIHPITTLKELLLARAWPCVGQIRTSNHEDNDRALEFHQFHHKWAMGIFWLSLNS